MKQNMSAYFSNLSYQQDNLTYPAPGEQNFLCFSKSSPHPVNTSGYPSQISSNGSFSELLSRNIWFPQNFVQMPCDKGRNEMAFIPPARDTVVAEQSHNEKESTMGGPQLAVRSEAGFINSESNSQLQGLSLSLGTQMTPSVSGPFQYPNSGFFSFSDIHFAFDGKETTSCEVDLSNQRRELGNSECLPPGFTRGSCNSVQTETLDDHQLAVSHKELYPGTYQYVPTGYANTLFSSKYLKAVQQFLDEVVSVHKALKLPERDKHQSSRGVGLDGSKEDNVTLSDTSKTTTISSELSPTERQDLKNKKTKLLSMLNEVNRRYRQYYHQMQIVVSSFEMVAGCEAAKPYTTLALQTISRQFRCLRDAISSQIQLTQSSLGEPDSLPHEQGEVIPRLRYVDQQLRQQRALQQLGVMQQTWRPQRGLPESSVSILRAWLFEHFLNPYPKDSEKIMLARQTGLTKNQVANWFINARVRLWKPMVEDMHKEEFGGDVESSLENEHRARIDNNSPTSETRGEELHELKSDHISDIEMKRPIEKSWFRNDYHGVDIADSRALNFQGDQGPSLLGHNFYPDAIIPSVGPDAGDYHFVGQQDRFGNPHVLHDFVV